MVAKRGRCARLVDGLVDHGIDTLTVPALLRTESVEFVCDVLIEAKHRLKNKDNNARYLNALKITMKHYAQSRINDMIDDELICTEDYDSTVAIYKSCYGHAPEDKLALGKAMQLLVRLSSSGEPVRRDVWRRLLTAAHKAAQAPIVSPQWHDRAARAIGYGHGSSAMAFALDQASNSNLMVFKRPFDLLSFFRSEDTRT